MKRSRWPFHSRSGWRAERRDKCKTWLISALLPGGIRWVWLRKDVYRWEEEEPSVRTHNCVQIHDQELMHHATHTNDAQPIKHAGAWGQPNKCVKYEHDDIPLEVLCEALSLTVQHVSKAENETDCCGTCVCAFGSGVALLVALAAPQLHQLQVELVQDVSIHRVNRIA